MKSIISLCVFAAMLSTSFGVTLKWYYGANVYVTDDGSTATLAANYTGSTPAGYLALVYVGQNVKAISDDTLLAIKDTDVIGTAAYQMGSTTKTASQWQNSNPSALITTDAGFSSGASFAILYNNGSTWDYIYAVNGSSVGAAVTDSIATLTDLSSNAQATSLYATGGSTVNGAIHAVAVPEPATGALALAGIALLFKRRKARA